MQCIACRLKYLLSQSDIFSHFGNNKGKASAGAGSAVAAESKKAEGQPEKTKRRGRPPGSANGTSSKDKDNFDEMDEDEKAIAREIGADDDETAESAVAQQKNTVLLKQPSCISGGQMRPYQLEGLNWMIRLKENGINGILADEMGLGKTLQSISILGYLMEYEGIRGPHLVMVPKSTLSNWCNEFARWCPSIRVIRFHGNKEERQEMAHTYFRASMAQEDRDWDVCVTTYEVVNLERSVLQKMAWRYLIIDEAHRLKNEESQFSQTVRMLSTQQRLLLTGTPLQNNLHELWALLNFLLPDVFASSEQFDEWFNLDVDDTEAKQRIINQLHKILRPFMLRRLKIDVEKSLPPKSETILFTGMSAIQKNLYRQILLRDIDTVNGGNSGSRTAILNIVMQLRKCCNHPYLFPGIEDRALDPLGEHLYANCGKMVLLDKLLGKMFARGHRVLIFSQMTRMLDILEDYMISRGYLYCRIDGNTSYEEREDRIADYNREGSDKFIFLLSTRAGGLGINLQTADTVILYDSDWNPQADLQAQDRAHRIGQKKPVQVFRLITDDSVEVKVVERAQQKLKLDAMVVQQGRLQEKEKKLSKQDLLETIRFGADKVFRSKDASISDDDIDFILEEGKKRTEELNEKLKAAEKGDMYDFRLDGGMSAQTFEGKDYSDRNLRENELSAALGFTFIDTGKRERKTVASYSETIARVANDEGVDKKPKIPRHLRLPKMEDWQFYDRDRLQELHAEELKLFDEMVERGEAPQSGSIIKFCVLDPEKHAEKLRLLGEAFGDWTKVHYNSFLKASAKHGRSAFEKIAKDVGKPVDETRRYSQAFWKRGSQVLSATDWERVVKQIEKGEKRLEEIQRLTSATAKLIMMFNDPWEELTFRNVGNQGRIFNAVEDRFLLCLTHLHGYGSWDAVRSSIRRCERFRFDFYLQSCSADALGKRCELLMRAAERELAEIERKKQAADALSASNARPKDTVELSKSKMEVLLKEIKAESSRLAQARVQLQKLKTVKAAAPAGAGSSETGKRASNDGKTSASTFLADNGDNVSPDGKVVKRPKREGEDDGGTGHASKAPINPRTSTKQVPDGLLPELCKLLQAAGPDGINKVVDRFVLKHPLIARRQVEMKIWDVAVKEKREEDTKTVWHIKPECEHYLNMENFCADDVVASGQPTDSKAQKRKREAEAQAAAAAAAVAAEEAEGGGGGEQKKAATPKAKAKSAAASSSSSATAGAGAGTGAADTEPKKYKRAKNWFAKENKAEYQEKMSDPAVKQLTALN